MIPQYIAWIPCISGELFFSHIQHGLGSYDLFLRKETITPSGVDEQHRKRQIILSSVVDWQDQDFFSKPFTGLYRVAVFARTESDKNELDGRIYFIEKNNLDKEELLEKFRPRRNDENEAKFVLQMKNISSDHEVISKSQFQENQNELERYIECIYDAVVHRVDFHIYENGLTTLKWFRSKRSNTSLPEPAVEAQRILCRQAFYYLKYSLHKHTHHAHTNESLTDIHQLSTCHGKNCHSLLRDLKRALVAIKRSGRFTAYSVAGVSEYGKSLIYSSNSFSLVDGKKSPCKQCQQKVSCQYQFSPETEIRYLENIERSLNLSTSAGMSPAEPGLIRKYLGNFRVSMLFALAIFSPIIAYLIRQKPNGAVSANLQSISRCETEAFDLTCKGAKLLSSIIQGDLWSMFTLVFLGVFCSGIVAAILTPWKRYPISEAVFLSARNYLIGKRVLNWRALKLLVLLAMWARKLHLITFKASNKTKFLVALALLITLWAINSMFHALINNLVPL